MSGSRHRPRVGLHYFATDQSLPVTDFARAAAERGFDAVLLPEHTHIPVSTVAPYPGDLPERYRRTLDPYVALSAVAATTGLAIGTCISLVAQHDPIALAKTIATLDFMSGGRFSLGVGYGWNVPELANHGREPGSRRDRPRVRAPDAGAVAGQRGRVPRRAREPLPQLGVAEAGPAGSRAPRLPAHAARLRRGRRLGGRLDRLRRRPRPVRRQVTTLRRQSGGGRTARPRAPLVRPMLGIVDDDTLGRSFDRFQALEIDQVVLDLQAVEGNVVAVLDRYAAVLAKL